MKGIQPANGRFCGLFLDSNKAAKLSQSSLQQSPNNRLLQRAFNPMANSWPLIHPFLLALAPFRRTSENRNESRFVINESRL